MSSTAEVVNLSEHPQIAEPAEDVTEVTEQSMRALSETLFKKMNQLEMTSVPWVFDIDQIPIECKWSQKIKEKALRKELTRIAQLEGHRTR